MAKTEARPSRPLSPHLTIFRPYVNMMVSILHRITGSINYAGSLLLAVWLAAAATGPDSFNLANALFASPPGLVVLFGFSWSLIHHGLGGIRHFMWDMGLGLTVPAFRFLSWATILGSLLITGIVWAIGLIKWGAL